MKTGDWRWVALLALPLLAPWVLVTWDGGWYVLFSVLWVDPGPRIVTMPEFLWQARFAVAPRTLATTWPVGLALYLAGLLTVSLRPERRVLTTSLFWLSGLMILFYGLGLSVRADILALPFGTVAAWGAAWASYRDPRRPTNADPLLREQ